MLGSERNPYPIQLLVNYWEMRPAAVGERLDELLRLGVTDITTFVPWQAVEADISHTLARFLQALADRKMTVSLILSPELGVHYSNSGLPKDICSKPENGALHTDGGPIVVNMPPNAFVVPSLLSAEFAKRYHSFLSRMDHFLADLGRRSEPGILDRITVALTGSYWKYFRSPRLSVQNPFSGTAGDFSTSASVAYRQRLEQFYSQREFMDPTPAAANRWKTRMMEDVNHRWFFQQSEDVFRMRSMQFVRRKALPIRVRQMELFTPEADPGFTYSNFLQMMAGGHADFFRLSSLLDDLASRASCVGDFRSNSYIHWTSIGGFRTLSDSEKQFLLLKSLLLMGGQGGGILIDEREWFDLSAGFRARAEVLARSIVHGELELKIRALYLTGHLWSPGGTLWEELSRRIGPSARMASSLDLVQRDRDADILIIDPSFIFTKEAILKILGWARNGRIVLLPRSPLFTESARLELERACAGARCMDISLGVAYRIYSSLAGGEGKIVVYELPERDLAASGKGEYLSAWQSFVSSILAMAGIHPNCSVSDSRLSSIALEKKNGGLGLFILNGGGRPVSADIIFPTDVCVSDLASSMSSTADLAKERTGSVPANRFALEVPPCGVLPLSIHGTALDQERERRAALKLADETKKNAAAAAKAMLPGLEQTDLGTTWN